jgi:hypothetical protein
LVRRPNAKRPLGRPGCRRKDHIKMDIQELGWEERNGSIWLTTGAGGGICK